jgi:protease I
MKTIQLPAPVTSGSVNVETALSKVQGLPAPTDQPLKLSEIGQLAWAAQGRPTSAAGAPIDDRTLMKVYFVLPDGMYLYNPASHSLEQIRDGDLRAQLQAGLMNQQNGPVGGCQVIVSGALKDFNTRYGAKARNIMLLLAGQMVQSIELQAVALNLTFVGINNVDITQARKLGGLGRDIEPLYVILVGYLATAPAGQAPPVNTAHKVVMIAPQNGFQDEEYFETRRGLEANSIQVRVASMRAGPIRSMGGMTAQADLPIGQVHPADFSAIIFVGGIGATEFVNNRPLWDLIRQAAAQRKIMAASGNAPAVLANAGVLKGTRVTGAVEIQSVLMASGATYTGRTVEKDGPLITSMGPGPQIVPLFVQAILDGLGGM